MTIEELFDHSFGTLFLTPPKTTFATDYFELRSKEGRIMSDALVQNLPYVPHTHQHHKEWKRRRTSSQRFQKYLAERESLTILEIGCGNGWFSQKLLGASNKVIGIDVGEDELTQARRCFEHPNLRYYCCENLTILPQNSFDIIVFNASIQYMVLNDEFWKSVFQLLKPDGSIHILDSPIYSEEEVSKAQERSKEYYSSMNSAVQEFYFPVSWNQLPKPMKTEYQPISYLTKLIPWYSPFPWVILHKP